MRKIKSKGIYTKITASFIIILVVLLLVIGIVLELVCKDFIKEQRTEYNSKMISMVNYDMERLYLKMSQLLYLLEELPEYSYATVRANSDQSVYSRVHSDLQFENTVKEIMYENDFEEYVDGVLFYYGQDDYYYVGDSVVSVQYDFNETQFIENYPESSNMYFVEGPVTTKINNISKPCMRFVLQPKVNKFEALKRGEENLNPFIMLEVNMDRIEQIMSQNFSAESGYVLTDLSGNIMCGRNGKKNLIADIKPMQKDNHVHTKEITMFWQQKTLVTKVYLEMFGWILSVGDSEEVLYGDIYSLMVKTEYLIGICGALGIIVSVIMSKKYFFQ